MPSPVASSDYTPPQTRNVTAQPLTSKLSAKEALKYDKVFSFFSQKISVNAGMYMNGSNVQFTVDGVETGLRLAYQMLRSVIGEQPHVKRKLKYTLGPERSQGVSNARIGRQKFLDMAMIARATSVAFPLIRTQAQNLDSLTESKGKYALFKDFYDADFIQETSAPFNIEITFSRKYIQDPKGDLGPNRRFISSGNAWMLPAGDFACHPYDPALSKEGCVYDNYARLSPLPLYLPNKRIRTWADGIEHYMREVALRISGQTSVAFTALHLRIEKDWTKWFSKGLCFNGTEIVRRAVVAARREQCPSRACPVAIYVMGNAYSDFNITWPSGVHHFSKYDILAHKIPSDTGSALVDAELGLRADVFVGTPRSGHSSIIFEDRHLLRKRCYAYERYTHACDQYVVNPMPEAIYCDSPACACRYGALRNHCLNMHCITTGICNVSFGEKTRTILNPKKRARDNRENSKAFVNKMTPMGTQYDAQVEPRKLKFTRLHSLKRRD